MKLRTASQLQDHLDGEFSWRLKEIASLKIAVKRSDYLSEATVIRAAVALLYAHWEGFVKNAASAYLNFVDCQGLRYNDLKSCFVVLGMKKHINGLIQSKRSHLNIATVDFMRESLDKRAQLRMDSAINTESNLSSAVFENILLSVGINPAGYQTRFNLIDESLLRRRNDIAHGEYLEVNADDWRHLADEVLVMLRQIKTDLENATALSSFKRPLPVQPAIP